MRTFQTQHMPTHGPKWGGGLGGAAWGEVRRSPLHANSAFPTKRVAPQPRWRGAEGKRPLRF